MDKDRVAGGVKKATGKVKEQAGKVLGDASTEAEGKADQAEGRAQGAVGHAKDAIREIAGKKSLPIIREEVAMGRGILLWLLGIPIPVIILLYLFHVV
jgi:uncharacterized protein YjbJ (UPF0337 family)